MKNLSIIIMIFLGLMGCSDYPQEPSLTYQSGGGKNSSSKDSLKVGGASPDSNDYEIIDEHEFSATALIKEGMSFEVGKATKSSKLHFILPLENNLSVSDAYHMEIQFLEPQVKAMKQLKSFLAGNQDTPQFNKVSTKRLCYAVAARLIGSKKGKSSHFECDFKAGADAQYQKVDLTGWTIEDLYDDQEPISEGDHDRIKNLDFKSVLILFQKAKKQPNARHFDMANPSRLDIYNQYDFGYRCLLDKKTSKKDENLVKYHRCRYPHDKSKSSS